ncbi:MAG: aerobic carbon-monoxide dehydrogenase large subunit, partial [Pseudonocardiales bacterium]|nr:aerobic carbon-monoxide dehydrogenase large subunit [Pseudonocardiales bacterium]
MTVTEQTPAPTTTEVGRARTRKEDARLITGRSRYTDSITPHGTLHMHVVRSP